MELDSERFAAWIEPLAKRSDEIVDLFFEVRRERVIELVDGEIRRARTSLESGVSARWRGRGQETLAFVSRADEAGAREAIRSLQTSLGRSPIPAKPARETASEADGSSPQAERWARRLAPLLTRIAPRHRFRWVWTEMDRRIVPARAPAVEVSRRLISVEGTFVAASRRGDERRSFSFHAPDAEGTADELRGALSHAAAPHEASVPCVSGETDVVLAEGCAAVLFHEILSHPLESDAPSPLSGLEQARLAIPELEVRDEPGRLDLFGGYEWDDEGVRPRTVKLLDGGRLAGRLTDRSRAAPSPSNGHARRAGPGDVPLVRGSNLLVAGGHATAEEMARRLSNGVWIERFEGGSIELASGRFRLRFPRARRVRRGRLSDELGSGVLAGEILTLLKSIESGLGREVRVDRSLGWCSRAGQVVPIQGAAPDILVRGVSLRAFG